MKSFIGGKQKIKDGVIYEKKMINRRCRIEEQPMFWHKDSEFWFGHTGTAVAEIFNAPTHLTGGNHQILFISDENPGMVVPINIHDVIFDETDI